MADSEEPREGEYPVCPDCGHPVEDCNAVTVARTEAERYLREYGVGGLEAAARAGRLIPPLRAIGADNPEPTYPWPDTASLHIPTFTDPTEQVHPVLDVLARLVSPMLTIKTAVRLREQGWQIPPRMESELAATGHLLIGFALKHGDQWTDAANRFFKVGKYAEDKESQDGNQA